MLSINDSVRAWSIRRVNPFLGVLQVVETDGGRATSANGVVWDIELKAERKNVWGSPNSTYKGVSFFRYGLWSADQGLVSRPLQPDLDNEAQEASCAFLIETVRRLLPELPLPLRDTEELWLLGADGEQALALLATVLPGEKRPSPEPKYWCSCLGANGVSSQRRFPQTDRLEAQVRERAGFNIKKRWIHRQADGSGIMELTSEHLARERFPAFLLREDWQDAEQAACVRDYLHWVAPGLLTLQGLHPEERDRMEQQLHIQAVSIEHHWHVYPELRNEETLKAARVQCLIEEMAVIKEAGND